MARSIGDLPWLDLTVPEAWRRATYPYSSWREERKGEPGVIGWGASKGGLLDIRVEVWSDGSTFIEGGKAGTLEFGNLNTNNREDAERWLETALNILRNVRT